MFKRRGRNDEYGVINGGPIAGSYKNATRMCSYTVHRLNLASLFFPVVFFIEASWNICQSS